MEAGIPVFDGKGYEIWRKKMKSLFLSQELWDMVEQGYTGFCENSKLGLRECRMKDGKALYFIQQGVSDTIFPYIMEAKSSKEAWDAIRNRFGDGFQQTKIEEIVTSGKESATITGNETATIRIERMVSKLTPIYEERCIFRVPESLRNGNEESYEPKVLSIGPYHRGKPRLASMEVHKIRYLQQLLQLSGNQSVDKLVEAITPEVEKVRKYYAEPINSISNDELAQMLVLDGCFIIELFRRFETRADFFPTSVDKDEYYDFSLNLFGYKHITNSLRDDPVINSDVLLNELQNDLLLIENQIPFFILEILCSEISSTILSLDTELEELTIKFLCRKYEMYRWWNKFFIDELFEHRLHLLEIAHKTSSCFYKKGLKEDISPKHNTFISCFYKKGLEEDISPSSNYGNFCFVNSATKLEEANVRLKAGTDQYGSTFNITFSNGKLTIPKITIDDHFEIEIRNFIAFELCQQHDSNNRYYCDYVVFMDHLIASTEDVELLICRHIITNQMVDFKSIENMFKKLKRYIVLSNPYAYFKISNDLTKYCECPWNKLFGSFKHKYTKNPWAFISVVVASILLGLTIIQTVFSILS
ncbi:UPF0481 protein At3g47200-like [Impatiens glandulifera]|uniref:UPF0481 protein At3g47200-like n=1 Tax=Impatiens glandulifera TaxID=253017 RepID=UPI001FB0B467|nr:UPF0481 protein At3g47200-like [Impatiens glandulifera]